MMLIPCESRVTQVKYFYTQTPLILLNAVLIQGICILFISKWWFQMLLHLPRVLLRRKSSSRVLCVCVGSGSGSAVSHRSAWARRSARTCCAAGSITSAPRRSTRNPRPFLSSCPLAASLKLQRCCTGKGETAQPVFPLVHTYFYFSVFFFN